RPLEQSDRCMDYAAQYHAGFRQPPWIHLSLGYCWPDTDTAVLHKCCVLIFHHSHSMCVHDGLLGFHSGFTMLVSKACMSFQVHRTWVTNILVGFSNRVTNTFKG